jgi:hypothetical protein
MLKLKDEVQVETIEMNELKDGQIAVIVEDFADYKSRVVQRYGDNVVALGMPSGKGWTDVQLNTLKVRVLEAGETLVISNNY